MNMREWLVIEHSWKNGVFAPDGAKKPCGYILRDVAEPLLGRSIEDGRITWFTREEGEKMRAHPEWTEKEPPGNVGQLIEAYDQYIELLVESESSLVGLAVVHGWHCPEDKVRRGKELREKIARLKQIVLSGSRETFDGS